MNLIPISYCGNRVLPEHRAARLALKVRDNVQTTLSFGRRCSRQRGRKTVRDNTGSRAFIEAGGTTTGQDERGNSLAFWAG